MRNTTRTTAWALPALIILTIFTLSGRSWGAAPRIAAGDNHTVSLHADGTLWASGLNQSGQLGDGSLTSRTLPVQVGSENRWQAVAAGADHTLALKADGTLWAWGSNASGQLGVLLPGGIPVPGQNAPLQVGTDRDWVAVAAGSASSYALKGDGTLWAWGQGNLGQLGNGSFARQNLPVAVANPAGGRYTALSAGADHALALMADGSLWSWGSNASGQLGQGPAPADPATPAQVLVAGAPSDNDWSALAAGGGHSLALKADGTLWAWGDNGSGQLGIGSTLPQDLPVRIGTDRDWSAPTAGSLHSLALKRDGTLWGWGDNSSGQLGTGQLGQQVSPIAVSPATAVNLVAVSGGAFHSAALKADGGIYAWGGNLDGQLGDGTLTGALTPLLIGSDGQGWIAGEPGNQFSVARRSNGTLWSWGDNSSGQLGNGGSAAASAPARVDTQTNWAAHAAGFAHVVALKADGTLWTWGDNSSGQLGDNTLNPSPFPLQVTTTKPTSAANDWAAVSAGDFHTLALKADGTLWAWGDNSSGQLGDSTNTPNGKQPNQIVTGNPGNFDSNWVAIAAGGSHSLGLQVDGTLWAWGDNTSGQLGDPSIVGSVNFPSQIVNFNPPPQNLGFNSGWKQIAAGFVHSAALQADGTLWSWGSNFDGQLGNGDPGLPNPADQPAPVAVLNPGAAPYLAVAVGDAHTVARQADGTLWSWGRNLDGQLGSGSTDASLAPHATPVREAGNASDWSASALGGSHSMGLKADGTLWSWGSNASGQLGDGTLADRNLPAPLLEGVLQVAAGLNLGTGYLGGTAPAASLGIRNSGNGDLFVAGFSVTGTDAALFSVSPGTCGTLAFVLPAGGSCQLGLGFQAAAPTGAKSAVLGISSSDPGQPQRQVNLAALAAQHTVTLSPGPNGAIFGPTLVNDNATPSYSIVPATTFHVVDVAVNGVSRGALTALTLPAVKGDLTISASFAIDSFAVQFASGGNGTLTGNANQTIAFGSATTTVTAVPAPGYHFVNWTEGGLVVSGNAALTLSGVSSARTLTANFAVDSFAVNFLSGGNGTLTGNASQTVNFAASAATVAAVAAPHFHFVNWTEAGLEFSNSAALTITNVSSARTLTANFAIDTFAVTAASGAKGAISPPGQTLVPYGSSITYSFTPAAGYQVVDVVVDGASQGAPSSYTFANVTAAGHAINVIFIPDGDLNRDGQVNVVDALLALQVAVQLRNATPFELLHGDVAPLDGAGIPLPDAQIGIADALGILRKAVGLPSTF